MDIGPKMFLKIGFSGYFSRWEQISQSRRANRGFLDVDFSNVPSLKSNPSLLHDMCMTLLHAIGVKIWKVYWFTPFTCNFITSKTAKTRTHSLCIHRHTCLESVPFRMQYPVWYVLPNMLCAVCCVVCCVLCAAFGFSCVVRVSLHPRSVK